MRAEYIDHMGSDASVVKAARVSFAADGLEFDGGRDSGLIGYLAKHNHWTPFSHTSITLRMTAPVPIRTQCFKHKVGFSENEESRRYISSNPKFFIPRQFRKHPEGSVKQGSGEDMHPTGDKYWRRHFQTVNTMCLESYEMALAGGMCPEQARFLLPQGTEVSWYWTGSLSAYARFFKQRTDPHAQQEIKILALEVGEILKPLYPVAWGALTS
jgi:thymidylate synthase (FAD)|tara:strand:- start:1016 stop:1654 length:639 start_codon:yes stop_codon:yes gene_type:complete